MLGPLGIKELVIILVLLILLFGARRLPAIGRGLGESFSGFRKAIRGDSESGRDDVSPQSRPDAPGHSGDGPGPSAQTPRD